MQGIELAPGLVYSCDSEPGISRRRYGRGFIYRHANGKTVTEEAVLARIKSLAVPPAYRDVWICADENGHLQATGIDAKGRKQYRYHPAFRATQEETKYHRMLQFGKALPSLREKISADLRRPGLPRERVLAAIVTLLDRSHLRIGNAEYAKANGSFGLTTLRTRHVNVHGSKVKFDFVGKSHVKQHLELHDRRLARLVDKIQDLPGQDLFRYIAEDGKISTVTSNDVNSYIASLSGEHFTAKDFRTWWGSVYALAELQVLETPDSIRSMKSSVSEVIKTVARKLGNTPAVCRKSYIHPHVIECFTKGILPKSKSSDDPERAFIKLLKCKV